MVKLYFNSKKARCFSSFRSCFLEGQRVLIFDRVELAFFFILNFKGVVKGMVTKIKGKRSGNENSKNRWY